MIGFKKFSLKINGDLIKRKDLVDIARPTEFVPYWVFKFADGDKIFAAGDITLILEDTKE